MPPNLRRGLHAILRGKKAGPAVSVAIQPITPTSEEQPDRFVSILENEEIQDEQQLQRALIESLHAALEEERVVTVERLREKDEQIKRMQQTATQLSVQSDHLLEAAMSSHELKEENEDLKARLKEYQVSLARMVEMQAQTQKELETLRAQTRETGNSNRNRSDNVQDLPDNSWARSIDEERSATRDHIKLLEENVESAMELAETLKQQLEQQQLWHQEQIKRIMTSNPLKVSTARQLIAHKGLSDRFSAMPNVDPAAEERVKNIASIHELTSDLLGARLSEEQVISFLRETDHPSFDLASQICRSCGLPKIYSPGNPSLSEFSRTLPVAHTDLCNSWACKDCYLHGIIESLHGDYWTVDLRKSSWLKCPAPDCPDPLLDINDRTAFQSLLEIHGGRNMVYHLAV